VSGVALLAALGVGLLRASGPPGEQRVRGPVTAVEARDIGHAASLAVRGADGREWRFQVDEAVDMTPGHLREHMTFGEPVTVYYRRESDALVAVRVTD
jgi:hypothetical protein